MYIDFGNPENRSMEKGKLYLPKRMEPSQDAFEKVGFVFKNIGHRVFYEVVLPEGWEYDGWDIMDQNGVRRVWLRLDSNLNYQDGRMELYPRYRIDEEWFKDASSKMYTKIQVVVLDRQKEDWIIWSAGECDFHASDEQEKLHRDAKKYMKENFPDYEDPTAYWD